MKKSCSQSFQLLSVLFFLFFTATVFTGCNKDDSESELCKDIPSLDGEVTFNGKKEKLSVAQLIRSSLGSEETYFFQIASIASDCNELHSITFTIEVPENSSLNGTYQFKDFFDADENDAFGAFTTQQLNPISSKLVDIESGTLKATDMGGDNYTLDIDATLSNDEKVEMVLTHDF